MTQRKADRLNDMLECLNRAGTAGMTRRQFAECMGLKISPYLTELVETLVTHGYATKLMDNSGKLPTWKYYPIVQAQ